MKRLRWVGAVVLLPLATILTTGLNGLTTRGTWQNEYVAWYAITLSLDDLWRLFGVIDVVKAAYFVPMHFWVAVVGDSQAALRAPSLAAMCVAVVSTSLIGRRLFGTAAGTVSGMILAFTPAAIRYGQELQPYAWTLAAVTLSTLIVLYAMPSQSRLLWISYWAVTTFAGWTHVVSLAILLVHGLFFLRAMYEQDREKMPLWPVAAGLTVAGTMPIILLGSKQSGAISWIKMGRKELLNFPADMFMSAPVAAVVLSAAALTITTSFLLRRQRADVSILLIWAVFPPLVGVVTFPWLHTFLPRYFLFTLPAWILLAGALSAPVLRRASLRYIAVSAAVGCLLAVAGLGVAGREVARQSPVDGRPDFRTAVNIMAARQQPGDAIAYGGTAMSWIRQAVDYELRGRPKPVDIFLGKRSQDMGWYLSKECVYPPTCALGVDRVWLITTATPKDPTTELYKVKAEVLRRWFTIVEIHQATKVRVVLLVRRPELTRV